MHRRLALMIMPAMLVVWTGAQCSPATDVPKEIPAGTYRGSVGGTSELADLNGTVLQTSPISTSITLVIDATGKPISMNVEGSANAPSQTITTFTVGQSQRFQYSYLDAQNGQVNVDYTAKVIRAGYGTSAYVVEYEFNGTQTTSFGVTTMFGKNEYQLYNQNAAVWVVHNQSSTLNAPGGQGSFKSTLFEAGILPQVN